MRGSREGEDQGQGDDLVTANDIARRLHVSLRRVDRVLARCQIVECQRAGIIRLFAPEQVTAIEAALAPVCSGGGR